MSFCDSFLVLFLLLHCTVGEVSHERVEPTISCLYNAVILIDCLTSFQNWYLTMQNRFHGNEQTNDARNLFLLSNADVTIENPSNNTLIESNSFDVEVSYGGKSSLFSFLRRFSKVELLLDSKVVATKKSGFLGLSFPAGQATFSINVTDLVDGSHSLQAKAKQFLGSTKESKEVVFKLDRTPVFLKNFIGGSFLQGGTNSASEVIEEKDGVNYNVKSNFTVANGGVVALSGVSSLIKSVNCSMGDTVFIKFFDVVEEGFLNAMFPFNSTLVIDGSVFGSCYLGNTTEGSVSDNDLFQDTEDGFLTIEYIKFDVNEKDVTIRGAPSSYLYMFEDFTLKVLPVDFDIIETNSTEERRLAYKEIARTFPLSYSNFPPVSSLLKAGFNGILLASIGSGLDVTWSNERNFYISVYLDYTMTYSGTSTLSAKKGKQGWDDYLARQASFPILEFPAPTVLQKLKLPVPKLRLSLDVFSYLKYDLDSSEDLSLTTSTSGGFGARRLVFTIQVKPSIPSSPLMLPTGQMALQQSQTNKLQVVGTPTIQTSIPNGLKSNTNVRSGFEINFIFDLFGSGRLSIFESALLAFNIDAVSGDSLKPAPRNGINYGDCSKCHLFETSVDFVTLPLAWSGSLTLSIPVFVKPPGGFCVPYIPYNIVKPYCMGFVNPSNFQAKTLLIKNSGDITKGGRLDALRLCSNLRSTDEVCESVCCMSGNFCASDGKCKPVTVQR